MMDDQQMATNLATQLLQQLDSKIHSTPNDPDKYVMKRNLKEISETLKVGPILILIQGQVKQIKYHYIFCKISQ